MSVLLKRIVPEDDRHTYINERTRVDVIPDTIMTYKIPCHKRAAPCKIFFRYPEDQKHADLMVYVSNYEANPSASKFDIRASRPQVITVEEPGKMSSAFSNFNIFITFES
jgi:hypothetical protein